MLNQTTWDNLKSWQDLGQGSTLTVVDCPGQLILGEGKYKITASGPWTIASICSILNFSDCHNRQSMSVASRASDKFWGQVPQIFFFSLGKKIYSVSV